MIPSGKLISAARTVLGWTQHDLARAAGLHRNAVVYWEKHEVITHKHQPKYGNSGPKRIEDALSRAGIMFITEPAPGLCLCASSPKKPHQHAHAQARVMG
jgi:predicted transcriptional regulator